MASMLLSDSAEILSVIWVSSFIDSLFNSVKTAVNDFLVIPTTS